MVIDIQSRRAMAGWKTEGQPSRLNRKCTCAGEEEVRPCQALASTASNSPCLDLFYVLPTSGRLSEIFTKPKAQRVPEFAGGPFPPSATLQLVNQGNNWWNEIQCLLTIQEKKCNYTHAGHESIWKSIRKTSFDFTVGFVTKKEYNESPPLFLSLCVL